MYNVTEGETIEQKFERIINNGEPIKDGAPIIYTERKDGINASYNIRTDRFDIALDGMDIVAKTIQAKREERARVREEKEGKVIDLNRSNESIQGTDWNPN